MAVYTRTGDKGETKVLNKKTGELVKISKTSKRIKTIGAIDELNSFLGIVRSESTKNQKIILETQRNLFTINSILAGAKLRFSRTKTRSLERQIDNWEGTLPVLKNFIIYGGVCEGADIFYARALCRKAERALVGFSKVEEVKESILIYINRLSDFLFMMARNTNFEAKAREEYWYSKKR